jgi:hypothetical protein
VGRSTNDNQNFGDFTQPFVDNCVVLFWNICCGHFFQRFACGHDTGYIGVQSNKHKSKINVIPMLKREDDETATNGHAGASHV